MSKPYTFDKCNLGFFLLMTYKDQLRDPRWQRVQSEVRERDKYKCQMCGCTNSFLHVHHLYYEKGLKAWEYDKESLITLCESCHEAAHTSLPKIISLIIFSMAKGKECLIDIENRLKESIK